MRMMLRHDQIKPGHLMCVNGKWVRVTVCDALTDGRWRIWWDAAVTGILTRPDIKSLVIVPNARFWVWEYGGWVKLTLKPGQRLADYYGGPHEEGHSSTVVAWEYDADEMVVQFETDTHATDCDGPYYYYGESWCPVGALQAMPPVGMGPDECGWPMDVIDVPRPAWRRGAVSQRDVYAEQMGY